MQNKAYHCKIQQLQTYSWFELASVERPNESFYRFSTFSMLFLLSMLIKTQSSNEKEQTKQKHYIQQLKMLLCADDRKIFTILNHMLGEICM